MSKVEEAVSTFKEGFLCSQALLSTYGKQFGLSREIALRVSAAFGGGMSRMGETCGAVTGAFMAIGLKYGNTKADNEKAREKTYKVVREFVDKFKARHGSLQCKDLLGCDISTPEGRSIAKENKLYDTVCPKFVQDAAEIMEQILEP
jgi:C_GCAxxG_C_C family probable redox protein